MKKLFLLPALSALFALSALLPARPLSASAAEGGYAAVVSQDAWFYASPDGKDGLFLLPYTYCVRILEEGEEYCAVEYGENGEDSCAIAGYCRTDRLHPLDFVPQHAFLRKKVTVTYEAALPVSPFGDDLFRKTTAEFSYYGARYADDGTCYLYLYGKDPATGRTAFAYLAGEIPAYDLNEQYLPSAQGGGSAVQSKGGLTAAHIVAICVGCLAVAGVAVFMLRGKAVPREEVSDF